MPAFNNVKPCMPWLVKGFVYNLRYWTNNDNDLIVRTIMKKRQAVIVFCTWLSLLERVENAALVLRSLKILLCLI